LELHIDHSTIKRKQYNRIKVQYNLTISFQIATLI